MPQSLDHFCAALLLGLYVVGGCGGKTFETDQPRTLMGSGGTNGKGSTSSDSAIGTGGANATESVGGATAGSGLVPISPGELEIVQDASCTELDLLQSDGGTDSSSCKVTPPESLTTPLICGRQFLPDRSNLVYFKGDGTAFLVVSTNADCPNGDGYFYDPMGGDIVLCAHTCAAVQQDAAASVVLYSACQTLPCIL